VSRIGILQCGRQDPRSQNVCEDTCAVCFTFRFFHFPIIWPAFFLGLVFKLDKAVLSEPHFGRGWWFDVTAQGGRVAKNVRRERHVRFMAVSVRCDQRGIEFFRNV